MQRRLLPAAKTVMQFFRPTLYKLIFTFEWIVYVLLTFVERGTIDPAALPAVLWPLFLLYCLGCALVAWSQRTDRLAGARGLALLIVAMVAVDQGSKTLAVATLPTGASVPLVEGWLHVANIHNATWSWLGLAWLPPVLAVVAALVLPLSVLVHRYYVSTRRQSLWADLAFVGVFAGYASWLVDIFARGYIVDVVHIPGLVAVDVKDLFLSLGICVVIEVLDNPAISLRFEGWKAESESTRRLAAELAAFATSELRAWWTAILRSIDATRG